MDHHIKPLTQVTRRDVRAMAHGAADRGENLADANVFAPGSENFKKFELDFLERSCEFA